ncbi:hypothetical protein BG015_002624 [Linnemannia schmuckeri]|uniref:Uncharacterized protein n=1 Tax=Linnemannia schmuckeri TaxID=64567 RepID=A0A9P5RRR5_9FUNG|nr:hypothetical protein BG015_002624 [Linnemannia schmuckeri]
MIERHQIFLETFTEHTTAQHTKFMASMTEHHMTYLQAFITAQETVDDRRRCEVAKDISQFMRQQTPFSEADSNTFSQCIEEAKRKFQAIRAGVEYVEDPSVVTPRGRPRSKRLKSQAEIASERVSKKFRVHDSEFNVEY